MLIFILSVLSDAFEVDYRLPVDFLAELRRRLDEIARSEATYNYLTIVQSSGYGKTRAIHQLAIHHPLIYVCFRNSHSSGYPFATPKSDVMLGEIWRAAGVEEAETVAYYWLCSMVYIFGRRVPHNSTELLNNTVR
jgi:hypothetical protein